MRSLWLLVLVWSCESAPPSPPTPPVDDDKKIVDDEVPTDPEQQARLATLDKIREYLANPRKRSPVEAKERFTKAYLDYTFAYGYARLGKPKFAQKLAWQARRSLRDVRDDTVHWFLIAAYEARIAQATAGERHETPLPDAALAAYAALDRVARYKVDRLREASWILAPLETIDAIGAFSKRTDARGPEIEAVITIRDLGARRRAIVALVDQAGALTAPADQARVLGGTLELAFQLTPTEAKPMLRAANQLVAKLSVSDRGWLYAKLLVAGDYFADSDIVATATTGIIVDGPSGNELQTPLFHGIRISQRAKSGGTHVTDLLSAFDRATRPTLGARVVWAAPSTLVGDLKAAEAVLAEAHTLLTNDMTLTARLDLVRTLSSAYHIAPVHIARRGIDKLIDLWHPITDSFGTNSHYCLSAIAFADSLVLAISR